MIRRILASSRFFIAFAVLGSFLSAVVLMVFSTLLVADITLDAIFDKEMNEATTKHLSVQFIELIDVILLATVLYIVALGLYKLFIDDELPLPKWLPINTLDELKTRLVNVVVVLLGVNFLGVVVDWDGERAIIYYGTAIGIVIAALAIFTAVSHQSYVPTHARRTSTASESPPDAPVVPVEPPPPDEDRV